MLQIQMILLAPFACFGLRELIKLFASQELDIEKVYLFTAFSIVFPLCIWTVGFFFGEEGMFLILITSI